MCSPAVPQRDEKRWLEILYSAHKTRCSFPSFRGKRQEKDLLSHHFQIAVCCVTIETHLNYFEVDHTFNVTLKYWYNKRQILQKPQTTHSLWM